MTKWKVYQNVIIPNISPKDEAEESIEEIKEAIKKSKCYLARWTTDFDSDVYRDFYYLICDKAFEISEIKSKSIRYEIRKGLKNCQVNIITKQILLEEGYYVYIKAFKKYKTNISKMTKKQFEKMVHEFNESIDIWGVFCENRLVAWSIVKVYDEYCDCMIEKYNPYYLKFNVSAALNYELICYYIKNKNKYLLSGTKSLNHDTNIQDYLEKKFNYKKRYCKLHVIYIWYIKIFVHFLYPFRKIFYKYKIGLLSKIAVVLRHEEIIRRQELQHKTV